MEQIILLYFCVNCETSSCCTLSETHHWCWW